jgi:hypothetical protein
MFADALRYLDYANLPVTQKVKLGLQSDKLNRDEALKYIDDRQRLDLKL